MSLPCMLGPGDPMPPECPSIDKSQELQGLVATNSQLLCGPGVGGTNITLAMANKDQGASHIIHEQVPLLVPGKEHHLISSNKHIVTPPPQAATGRT